MRILIAALGFVAGLSSAAWANCPIGSYPYVDSWGNSICKAFGSGETVTIERGPGGSCPYGTFPTVDSWGNRVCQEFGRNGRTYFDTSEGCPYGTFPTVDSWGNPSCKSF